MLEFQTQFCLFSPFQTIPYCNMKKNGSNATKIISMLFKALEVRLRDLFGGRGGEKDEASEELSCMRKSRKGMRVRIWSTIQFGTYVSIRQKKEGCQRFEYLHMNRAKFGEDVWFRL